MRAIRPDTHADTNCNCDDNSDSYANRNPHAYSYSNANSYSDTHGNAESNTNSETQSNAEVSPHPAATPVTFVCENEKRNQRLHSSGWRSRAPCFVRDCRAFVSDQRT